eukprot:Colp12_sorted_trinity150504_noHs@18298
MSKNTAHFTSDGGLILFPGEVAQYTCKNVSTIVGKDKATGALFLTTFRIVVWAKKSSEGVSSYNLPLTLLRDVSVEQPLLGANYVKGTCEGSPEPGGFPNATDFKISFTEGGAIEFGTKLFNLLSALQNAPPSYAYTTTYAQPNTAFVPPAATGPYARSKEEEAAQGSTADLPPSYNDTVSKR